MQGSHAPNGAGNTPAAPLQAADDGPACAAVPLTAAQRRVLACLQAAWSAGRTVDSLDHLCELLGLRSRGALHRHVEALVGAGLIEPLDRHRLGLRPTKAAWLQPAPSPAAPEVRRLTRPPALPRPLATHATLRRLPRLGRVAAGAPLDAVFDEAELEVPDHLVPPGDAFVLEVRGDSMSGDGILDGDLVVVAMDAHVRPGELAVLLVAGEGSTLKRFRREGAFLRLIPSNPAFSEQLVPAHAVTVQGRVTGLMRKL